MNKKSTLGFILLAIGIITQFVLENDIIDFISAIIIGLGIGLIIAEKYR